MQQPARQTWVAFERWLERARVPAPLRPDYHKWPRFYLDSQGICCRLQGCASRLQHRASSIHYPASSDYRPQRDAPGPFALIVLRASAGLSEEDYHAMHEPYTGDTHANSNAEELADTRAGAFRQAA